MPEGWRRAPPRVVGHRGAPREAPENTLPAFEACVGAGVPAVELDVRVTADGEVVVHHDRALGRVIPGDGLVETQKAADLVARGVPTLADVLALPLLFDVEIKADADNAPEAPARVLDVVRAADALERVLVTSFDVELADLYARLAHVPAGAILPFPPDADDLASYPRLTYVALLEDAAIPEALETCREAGRAVYVWTVNDETSARGLLAQGAAGVITDRPLPLWRALGASATGR